MAPEDKKIYTLYLDGVEIPPEQIGEIKLSMQEPELESLPPCESLELTIRTPKHCRCGSRKRFIKLMMSEGISRNYAQWLAGFARTMMPYGEAWRDYILYKYWKRCAYDNRVD